MLSTQTRCQDPPVSIRPGSPLLWGLLIAYLIGLLWTLVIPIFEKPDEIHHYAYVRYVTDNKRIPIQGTSNPPFVEEESQQPPLYYLVLSTANYALDRLGISDPMIPEWSGLVNPKGPIRTGEEKRFWLSPDGSTVAARGTSRILILRLISLAIALLAVPFLIWTMDGLHAYTFWPKLLLIILFTSLPQMTFIFTSVTNDVALVLFSSVVLFFMLSRDISQRKEAFLLGAAYCLCIYSKQTALTMMPVVIAAPLIRFGNIKRARIASLLIFLSILIIVGPMYIRNHLIYGDFLARQEIIDPAFYWWNIDKKSLLSYYFLFEFPRTVTTSFIGQFGFLGIYLPTVMYIVYLLILVAGILSESIFFIFGLLRLWPVSQTKDHSSDGALVAQSTIMLSLIVLAVVGLVFYNTQVTQPQGRLLFVAAPSIFVMVARGLARLIGYVPSYIPAGLLICGTLIAMNLIALFWYVRPYYY